MAETKRVSDQYKISAPSIVLDGNLSVLGSTTSVESVNSTISDNVIFLNSGETGAGVVTLGSTAGITIDRGSLPDVTLRWNESTDTWQITTDGSTYADIATSSGSIGGSDGMVQYNNGGNFGGESNFVYDDSTNLLYISNVVLGNDAITNSVTNGNITISGNGTGVVDFSGVTAFDYQGSTPSSTASKTKFYAATPGAGDSGLYFVNTVASDELISKNKALMMALIM